MTYKEFYIKLINAMVSCDVAEFTKLENANPKWFADVIRDVLKILRKYTMYGIDD